MLGVALDRGFGTATRVDAVGVSVVIVEAHLDGAALVAEAGGVGRSPAGTIGLGRHRVPSRKEAPTPPHRMTTFIVCFGLKRRKERFLSEPRT